MTDAERIVALESALADVLGMADAHAERLERTKGAAAAASAARRSIEAARALLPGNLQ